MSFSFARWVRRTFARTVPNSSRKAHRPKLRCEHLEDRVVPAFAEFVDPNPNAGNLFGHTVLVLSTGNVVVTSPFDDAGGTDAGAVYLFNGATGALISTLRGSSANDQIGIGGIKALPNGNYVLLNPTWDNGGLADAGAVTWGSGITGVSGAVSAANSLVGSSANDQVGNGGVTTLSNGNYLVLAPTWDNGAATNAGAVTWGSGTAGVSGAVSAANSLVGSSAGDGVGGGGVTTLSNGNYVVRSFVWDNGGVANAGAVTWGSGTAGVSGAVSAANSLVGSTAGDRVGNGEITELSNGNYVVKSGLWDNGAAADAGAVTWGSGTAGVSGAVSAANSLVGAAANDGLNVFLTVLANGNYVVRNPHWDNGAVTNAGAVTWGSGTAGVSGAISAANSLVGSTAGDRVGFGGVVALSNGNYVVMSFEWDNGAAADAGAATWGSGTAGVSGAVSAANSLVGSTANDGVGGVVELENGNYVAVSSNWNNGGLVAAGAVTWGNGQTGVAGAVSAVNSLVGSSASDNVGSSGVVALSNGNYVVLSPNWDNGSVSGAGAVTWGSGTTGITGAVSAANSLVGSSEIDFVGSSGARELENGNYVVLTPNWDNGAVTDAGAATWGSGTAGVSGVVSAANSLVGSSANDSVGTDVAALSNGNYVVRSFYWDNGAATDAGAVTWGSGTTGVSGVVSAANSLVGSTADERIGDFGVQALSNGNYVVSSRFWDNGAATDVGAVTWGSGTTGVSGLVSAANSLVGSATNDLLNFGGVVTLSNGNYLVVSSSWDNGAVTDAGAVTWGSGITGVSGVVSAANSLVGSTANDLIGSRAVIELSNGNYVVVSTSWDNGAVTDAGAVTWGSGTTGITGAVSAANSLVGTVASAYLTDVTADDENLTFYAAFLADGGGRVRIGSQLGSPPTDTGLSNDSIAENRPAGTAVGLFSTTDSTAGDTFTYTLVTGTGDTDNAGFTIVGNELRTAASFNFETKNSYSIRVRTTDATGLEYEEQFTITVTDANDPPTVTGGPTASVNAAENATAATTVAATDEDQPAQTVTYSISGGADADKFTIDGATGVLTFLAAPNFEAPGDDDGDNVYEVTVQVSDGAGGSDTQDISVTVTDAPESATIDGTSTGSVTEDGTLTAGDTFTVTDPDAGEATFQTPASLTGTYGTFTFNTATGAWGYTLDNALPAVQALAAGETLTDTLTVLSSDGTAQRVITVTITGAADQSVVDPVVVDRTEGNTAAALAASGTLSLTTVDDPAPTFVPQAAAVGLYGTFTLDAAGNWTYTASSAHDEFAAGATYTDEFTVATTDGASSSVTIRIAGTNDAPVAQPGTLAATEGVARSGTATATDADTQTAGLTYSLVGANGGAVNGTVTMAPNGTFTYTPFGDFNGADSFTFMVFDGALSNTAVVAVTVDAVNDAPTLSLAGNVSVGQDSGAYAQGGFAAFGPGGGPDEAGQAASYTVTTDNPGLFSSAPSIGPDGTLRFTPAAGVSGTATVTVTASDGQADAPVRTFTITVNAAPPAPAPARSPFVDVPWQAFGLMAAVGDVTGDGVADLVLGTTAGRPTVGVFDGATGQLLFGGPVPSSGTAASVAVGDVTGDGAAEVIVGAGGMVFVFDPRTGAVGALPVFAGWQGTTAVAVVDVDGDGLAELLVAGPSLALISPTAGVIRL